MRAVQLTRPWRCRACGCEQQAKVQAIGVGTSGLWGDAGQRAHDDAERSVATLLALARCPQCGYFDEVVAAKQARTRAIVGALLVAIGAGVVGVCAYLGLEERFFVYVALGVAVVMGGFGWLQWRLICMRYPSDVTGLVTLEAPPPPMPSRPVDPAQMAAFKWI
ncbi:MAG: hypothetical protein JO257_12405 [Deltaproteobacteria bacterium]|nr:hypothetical protein [Deltaproteobacteria bacterium]